jgi:predicted glycogen debranching enzyme
MKSGEAAMPPVSVDGGSSREWLETDGLGGFASGSVVGIRTRRYHALLLTATTPPTGRLVLVNGFDAWVETIGGRFDLSSQWYSPGVLGGSGAQNIESFKSTPWPSWVFKLADDMRLQQDIFVVHDAPVVCVTWKLLSSGGAAKLTVRPFLSGRDYHALHHRNAAFRFDATMRPNRVAWKPYNDVPGVTALSNGTYTHDPHWYNNFLYEAERARGLDCEEDLGSPGTLAWQLDAAEAVLIFTTADHATTLAQSEPLELLAPARQGECARR